MAVMLKQSTAVSIKLGPFVDEEDGFTPLTSLTISQADVRLAKNDGNWAQKNDSGSASHEENGWYEISLSTTDTNTLGTLIVAVNESGALPVWREFQVLNGPVYDSLVSGSDNLQVEAVAVSDTGINSRFAQQDTGAVASAVWGFSSRSLTEFNHDTGVSHTVWNATSRSVTDVTGFSDTGVNDRLARILADTDTGLRSVIAAEADGNVLSIRGDTGAADRLMKLAGEKLAPDGSFDTGTGQETHTFNIEVQAEVTLDTGVPVNVQVDTGLLVGSIWNATTRTLTDYHDTGIDQDLARAIARTAEADTGIRGMIADLDTGLRGVISGISGGSGADTGAIADAVWAKDTRTLTDFHDTGINQRLDAILGDTDTGLRAAISAATYSDTGPTVDLAAIKSQTDKMTFDTGGEILADIRRVNDVTVAGTGDTGTGDTWRPAAE